MNYIDQYNKYRSRYFALKHHQVGGSDIHVKKFDDFKNTISKTMIEIRCCLSDLGENKTNKSLQANFNYIKEVFGKFSVFFSSLFEYNEKIKHIDNSNVTINNIADHYIDNYANIINDIFSKYLEFIKSIQKYVVNEKINPVMLMNDRSKADKSQCDKFITSDCFTLLANQFFSKIISACEDLVKTDREYVDNININITSGRSTVKVLDNIIKNYPPKEKLMKMETNIESIKRIYKEIDNIVGNIYDMRSIIEFKDKKITELTKRRLFK